MRQSQGDLDAFKEDVDSGAASLGRLGLVASAAGAAILSFLGVSVRAAADAQKETLLLEQALRAAGAAADTRPYQDQASALQRLTGVSDETILSIQRLLVNFGATRDQVEQLTPRILNFAAATGRDATNSALLFGRALTGMPLTRVLGRMGEGVTLANDFGRAMQLLDQRFGGAAATLGQTFPGALSRLRSSFNDLLEVVGAPLLVPLTAIVNGLASILDRIRNVAKEAPLLTAAFVGAAAALGIFLLGAGGLLAFRAVLPQIAAGINAMTTALLGQKLAMVALSAETRRLIIVMTLLKTVLPIALLITAIGAAVLTLGAMIKTINETEAAERRAQTATISTSAALRDKIKDVQQLKQALEEAALGFKLLAAEQKATAAELAARRLSAAGLTAEQIQKIERDRAEAVADADQDEIKSTIAKTKEIIGQLRLRQRVLGDDKEIAKEIEAAQTRLAELTISLNENVLKREIEVQRERASSIKALADLRVRVEVETAQRTANVLRSQLESIKTIEAERLRSEEEGRQRRLAVTRLENDLRLDAIRRALDVQRQFEEDALSVRESLARSRSARFEAQALREGAARAEAVRQGFLTEEEAQQQADESRRKRLTAEFRDELDIANRRIALIQSNIERERALALQEAAIRAEVLDLETQVEIEAVKTRERIRESELRSAIAIARAETIARRAEIKARLDAEIAAAQAATILARSPEERKVRAQALDELIALRDQAVREQNDSLVAQERALADQLVVTQRGAIGEIDSIQRQGALRRRAIEEELAATLRRIDSTSIKERAQATRDLSELQLRLTRDLVEEEERLSEQVRKGTVTQAQADVRLKPLRDLATTIERVTRGEVLDVENALGRLEDWKAGVRDRVRELQPLVDALKNAAQQFTMPTGVTSPRPATVAAGAGAGQVTNLFTFQGTTLNLTPDETGLLQRIVQAIMGPEFNKEVAQYFRSLPGPRVP